MQAARGIASRKSASPSRPGNAIVAYKTIRMTEIAKRTAEAAPDYRPAEGGIAARARATAAPQYLTGLNPEQRDAV
ncbi:MAG: hypothetical protein EOP21_07130, partial [Hyphomicrobiales bacterium]